MSCTCSKTIYENPRTDCPIHKNTHLRTPPTICHHIFAIYVYERTSNRKWFAEATKDALQIFVSRDCDIKVEAIELAAKELK